ncbi:uncharacterized protein LOC113465126 [Ceratina calcarata]|uniref:Uncharacterized protein LOC113465126 n=1 Tax=Ceratina calcarata TaxID=156304 RepID=A0AAJ7SCI1_9HYME|nr:uncharacterized protein LOC113465126 [Ceratina calcarata]
MNEYQSRSTDEPVCLPERTQQLPSTEEVDQTLYLEQCQANSREFKIKFNKPIFFRRGCSKHCTGYNRDLDSSSFKLTVCTSRKNKWSNRLKRSKKRLQQFSNQIKKRTKKSIRKIKKIYRNIGATRVMGYHCDLRKCPSTILHCTTSSCVKPNMLFSKFQKFKERMRRSEEDTHRTACSSKTPGDASYEFKIMKEQSVGTNAVKGTST